MTKREQFIQWLGDAHAMESGIVTALQKHIADAKGQPKVRAALTKHLTETKRHASEMKKALSSLGATHPVIKESISKIGSLFVGFVAKAAGDVTVKNAIADFATEHLEIACYKSLIFTATKLGETKIANTCKGILKEEEAMAKALSRQLQGVNAVYLRSLENDTAGLKRKSSSVRNKRVQSTSDAKKKRAVRRK
ncbi:MAG: DUF892 family protein [Chthoniobacterales bacterium]